MIVTLIYAVAENRVIGRQGELPWRLPDDFKHFKATTLGHPVVMGRVTFETDAGLLPKRTNIVISRQPDARQRAQDAGAQTASSLEEALAPYQDTDQEVFIIGGSQLYQSAFPLCQRIWETRVHASPEGDTLLPSWDLSEFNTTEHAHHCADDRHPFAFTILRHDRKNPEASA